MESRKLTKLEIFLIVIVFALLAIIFSFTLNTPPQKTINTSKEDKFSQKVEVYEGEGSTIDEAINNSTQIQ